METKTLTAHFKGGSKDPGASIASDLKNGLAGEPPVLIVVFASPVFELEGVTSELSRQFVGTSVIGCTSSGEFTEEGRPVDR